MFTRDKWEEIIESLSANWVRTILTALGVVWGIFILVILLAAGTGLENGIKKGFGGLATNTMFMWAQNTSKPYKGMPKGRFYNFKIEDVAALKTEIEGLKYVSPRNQLGGFGGNNNVVRGLKTGAFNVYGDYPEIIRQQPMDITSGRFLNYNDIDQKRKVAVIGQTVKTTLFDKDEKALGDYIKINGVNFQVIGTFAKKGNGGQNAEEAQKEIYVPFSAFSQAFNRANNVDWMVITADNKNSITDLKTQVFDIIKQRHTIDPSDDRAVGNFDLYKEFKKIQGLFLALNIIAFGVGILVLLSGVIGISNIMLIVVKERTKEIGIRRALGATPWTIRSQILLESVFLTIISGMVGIVFATGVLMLANFMLDNMASADIMFANPTVNIGVIAIALLILVVSGILAGLIPAQNAIKVKPVDALRTE
ncbi:putative ABC transport system permease protein [Mesonia hippocampi]|uniref:Putative ABC transport system permease protein n=1 Tax=Mesonia hippocampi TaxID=1628250 RepID=A0A840EP66_9FLAO|nr:ABC transporter permease [Mesonia hippocampi]MBB4118770.1 putative ABC transport system permease protein [Mesonia hippocampi]